MPSFRIGVGLKIIIWPTARAERVRVRVCNKYFGKKGASFSLSRKWDSNSQQIEPKIYFERVKENRKKERTGLKLFTRTCTFLPSLGRPSYFLFAV
jgi:hypothetical protein